MHHLHRMGDPCEGASPAGCRRSLASPRRLFYLAVVVIGMLPVPSAGKEPDKQWTPSEVADQIEQTMRQFDQVSYRVRYVETRDANAFRLGQPRLLVAGPGDWHFRSDGRRWFADENGFTMTLGEAVTHRRHAVSGFDGQRHFSRERQTVKLGEDSLAAERLTPREVLWNAARSSGWLLRAIRDERARIEQQETLDGHDCLVIVSEFGNSQTTDDSAPPTWRFRISLAPDRCWLPLKTVIHHQGKLHSEEQLLQLVETPDGDWYPQQIILENHGRGESIVKKSITITELQLNPQFTEADFQHPDFIGCDIVDVRKNRSWHNDPWWPDMAPWLEAEFDWPRPTYQVQDDLQSHCDPEQEGQPAPPIHAARWLGEAPVVQAGEATAIGALRGDGHRITILVFYGGRAISPSPQWMAGLRELQRQYAPLNVRLVGVATSTDRSDLVEAAYTSMGLDFPVAIDTAAEDGYGRTFNAYKLKSYAGVFLIDHLGKLRLIDNRFLASDNLTILESRLRQLLADADTTGRLQLPETSSTPAARLEEHRAIKAEWTRQATDGEGVALITGQILIASEGRDSFGQAKGTQRLADDSVRITAEPVFRMLFSGNSGGWTLFRDRDRTASTKTDAMGNIALGQLRKGTYEITVQAPGLARVKRVVQLVTDQSHENLQVLLHQGDSILGQVVDSDGKPVVGALVRATRRHTNPETTQHSTTAHLPTSGALENGRATRTDEAGRFSFENLFDGAYTFEISASGFNQQTASVVPAGTQDVLVVLTPANNP